MYGEWFGVWGLKLWLRFEGCAVHPHIQKRRVHPRQPPLHACGMKNNLGLGFVGLGLGFVVCCLGFVGLGVGFVVQG